MEKGPGLLSVLLCLVWQTRSERNRASSVLALRGEPPDNTDGPCIGTTWDHLLLCSSVEEWVADICPNEQGHRITPSYVAFAPMVRGWWAMPPKNQAPSNPYTFGCQATY
jgi:hypothetical protein